MGDAARTLRDAIEALCALPQVRLVGVSRLYATAPVGPVAQPEFRNAAATLEVTREDGLDAAALDLLGSLKRIERTLGRRPRERWGPREVDLDLLVFGRNRLELDRPPGGRSIDAAVDRGAAARLLQVPHPEARERLFVLAPLADLVPGLVPPGWGETVEHARRRRERVEGPLAVRPIARWDARAGDWVPIR
jgi:2-amino-4-hydroxy-6-hydroxymethyldihydropteridine diphosphokinase